MQQNFLHHPSSSLKQMKHSQYVLKLAKLSTVLKFAVNGLNGQKLSMMVDLILLQLLFQAIQSSPNSSEPKGLATLSAAR
jgi:hypothetical protein